MQEINLYDLLKYYAKNWVAIISFTLLGLLAGLAYNNIIQTPLYKSEATLVLVNKTAEGATIPHNPTLVKNYVELFKSRSVLEPAMRDQGYGGSYEQLVANTTAVSPAGTELIRVSIASRSAQTSRAIAESAVEAFKSKMVSLYDVSNIEVVDEASQSSQPYNVSGTRQLVIAAVAGFVISIIILFLAYDYKHSRKDTHRDNEDESTPAPQIQHVSNLGSLDYDLPERFVKGSARRPLTPGHGSTAEELAGRTSVAKKGSSSVRNPRKTGF